MVSEDREVAKMMATPKVTQHTMIKHGETTCIGTQQEGLAVVYKRQEGKIQIFRGQCLLSMISLDPQVVSVLSALIPETVKCTVLGMENTNAAEQVTASHAPISTQGYKSINAKDAEKVEGKRGVLSEYRYVAQSDKQVSEGRLTKEKVSQGEKDTNGLSKYYELGRSGKNYGNGLGMEKLYWGNEGQDNGLGKEIEVFREIKRADQNRVRIEEKGENDEGRSENFEGSNEAQNLEVEYGSDGDQNTDNVNGAEEEEKSHSNRENEHPPGFPEAKYKVTVPRRSPRLEGKERMPYGGKTKPTAKKGGKYKLNFEERKEEIRAGLAISLIKESGARIEE